MDKNAKPSNRPTWVKYQAQFSTLQVREKYITLIAGALVIIYLLLWFLVFPLQEKTAAQSKLLNDLAQKTQQQKIQINMLDQALAQDYTQLLRQQLAEAKQEMTKTNSLLSNFSQGFVAAERVPSLLKELLVNSPHVKVVNFKVLPARAIEAAKLGEQQAQTLFFEHQIQLTLEGGYFNLQHYLETLKQSDAKLLIKQFDYQVQEYPAALLTLKIATVSANEKFIAL